MAIAESTGLGARLARRGRFLLANLDRRNFKATLLQETIALAPGTAPRLAFFNHFDSEGRVADYVLHHLGALALAGHAIVFMTTAKRLNAEALRALAPLCWMVARRRNIGLDIGGWPCAMRLYERRTGRRLAEANRVLITNDSVFGPLQPLPPLLDAMSSRQPDLWGISESLERGWHVQSYFLVFEREGPAFLSRWLSAFRFDPEREALIARHEVGLSSAARQKGLRIATLQSCEALAALVAEGGTEAAAARKWIDREGRVNPTHWFWRELIACFGSPYIKRDLLRDYDRQASTGEHWRQVLARAAPAFPVRLVEDYLQSLPG